MKHLETLAKLADIIRIMPQPFTIMDVQLEAGFSDTTVAKAVRNMCRMNYLKKLYRHNTGVCHRYIRTATFPADLPQIAIEPAQPEPVLTAAESAWRQFKATIEGDLQAGPKSWSSLGELAGKAQHGS